MTEAEITTRPIRLVGPDTQLLMNKYRTLDVGETWPYATVKEKTGIDVQNLRGSSACRSARRILKRDEKIDVVCVRGEGIHRCTPRETVMSRDSGRRGVRRHARRERIRQQCVDVAALSDEDKLDHCVGLSVFAMLEHAAGASASKKVAKLVHEQKQQLPVQKTLEAFATNGQ